jgi:dolichol-phosphate mannosyltransferase
VEPATLVSFVVPVHNEEGCLPLLFAEIERACCGLDYEVILVDDGSTDRSWEVIERQGQLDPRVRGLRLSRNFGQQAALVAGLEASRGEAVISLDADLQDPLEAALRMLAKWREGYDVVYGLRTDREGETWFKRGTAYLYYRLLAAIADRPPPADVGDFRLLSREALAALLRCPERDRYLRGLVAWIGYRQEFVPYRRRRRARGATKFSVARMTGFALAGVVSFSHLPLQFGTAAGAVALLGGVSALAWWGAAGRGGASAAALLAALVLLLGGAVLVQLGVLGLYLARALEEVRGRPLYLVAAVTGGARPGRPSGAAAGAAGPPRPGPPHAAPSSARQDEWLGPPAVPGRPASPSAWEAPTASRP